MAEEFPKDLAARTYAYYGDVRRTLADAHAVNCRWMVATLLTLNAGGLLALVNFRIDGLSLLTAALNFWYGIAFAIIISWYTQQKTIEFIRYASKLEEVWATAAATGIIESEKIQHLEDAKNSVGTNGATWLTGLSFMSFSLGLMAIGTSLS